MRPPHVARSHAEVLGELIGETQEIQKVRRAAACFNPACCLDSTGQTNLSGPPPRDERMSFVSE